MQRQLTNFCPLIKKECLQHQCKFFIKLMGIHPQTGNPVEDWDCAVAWLPVLLIENAKETRQGAAAVESFRNEMVRRQSQLAENLLSRLESTSIQSIQRRVLCNET